MRGITGPIPASASLTRNPYKRVAESDFEIPPALVRGRGSIRVTFIPEDGD